MALKLGPVAALLCLCAGCMTPPDARYVYQDGTYGVIGIPRNTSLGKKDFHQQAHELMTRHFPEGYEIIRAEEVIEGERTLDTSRKVELDSEPGVSALNQMIKLGKFARSTSLDQKNSLKITESRILYRRKPAGSSQGRDGFALAADESPQFYLDPNQEIRKCLKEAMSFLTKKDLKPPEPGNDAKLAEAKGKDEKVEKFDPSLERAGHSESKKIEPQAGNLSWTDRPVLVRMAVREPGRRARPA